MNAFVSENSNFELIFSTGDIPDLILNQSLYFFKSYQYLVFIKDNGEEKIPNKIRLNNIHFEYFDKKDIIRIYKSNTENGLVREIIIRTKNKKRNETSKLRNILYKHPFLHQKIKTIRRNIKNKKHLKPDTTLKKIHNISFLNKRVIPSKSLSNRSVLFLAHWLELGGAESFLLKSIQNANRQGSQCHLVTTVPSADEKLTLYKNEVVDLVQFHSLFKPEEFLEFIIGYITEKKIEIMHIHHSVLAYCTLPSIRILFPELHIVDTLHIMEYDTGGFVATSAHFSQYIDRHQIISKSLAVRHKSYNTFTEDRKYQVDYLANVELNPDLNNPYKKIIKNPYKFVFIGRYAFQKRPIYFIKSVEHFIKKYGKSLDQEFEFLMYGGGELESSLKAYVHKKKLPIKIFHETYEVDKILKESFACIVPSDNEGITLVSYESISNGTFYLTTNTGDQGEFLLNDFMVEDEIFNIPTKLAKKYYDLITEEKYYHSRFLVQKEKLSEFIDHSFDSNSLQNLYS